MAPRAKKLAWVPCILVVGALAGWFMAAIASPVSKPEVRFVRYISGSHAEFEMVNPTETAYQYSGYGESMPLYSLQIREQGGWSKNQAGWCGTGVSTCTLPPHTTRKFSASPEASEHRVGVALLSASAMRRHYSPSVPRNRVAEMLFNAWEALEEKLFGNRFEREIVWSRSVPPYSSPVQSAGETSQNTALRH